LQSNLSFNQSQIYKVMSNTLHIEIQKAAYSKINEFNLETSEFGKTPTDHMFLAEYHQGEWSNLRIEPFHPLELSPFNLSFHYGQTVFEGMKAYRMIDGNISVFRVRKHWERFNKSLTRMAMAEVPFDIFQQGLHAYLKIDNEWVPSVEDSSLYLRPFMIAYEDRVRVKAAEHFLFLIVGSPAKQYYLKPLNLFVETHYSRAASGGTGNAKCGGNYGGAFYPTLLANQKGFDQILWTDASTHQFIEESGTMNIMFVMDNVLVTPALTDSILDGVTRDSILTLAKDMGIPVEEKKLSIQELEKAFQENRVQEAFGTGTAAIVAPVGSITFENRTYQLPPFDENALMFQIKSQLNDIRTGKLPDKYHWNDIIYVTSKVNP
jgi:branched-chain amino acid aminotransferase